MPNILIYNIKKITTHAVYYLYQAMWTKNFLVWFPEKKNVERTSEQNQLTDAANKRGKFFIRRYRIQCSSSSLYIVER